MCDLCTESPDLKKLARESCVRQAEQLEEFASFLRKLSFGVVKPHDDKAKTAGILARSIIRDLVADWI